MRSRQASPMTCWRKVGQTQGADPELSESPESFYGKRILSAHTSQALTSRRLHNHSPGHAAGAPTSGRGHHSLCRKGELRCSWHPRSEYNQRNSTQFPLFRFQDPNHLGTWPRGKVENAVDFVIILHPVKPRFIMNINNGARSKTISQWS